MAGILPRQKISKAEKEADKGKWYKDNSTYIIDQSNFYSDDRAQMIELYLAAMGQLETASYKYVLNPYNTPDENLKNFPAKLRNYDNIIPILNLFLGERADRPFNHTTICINPDTPSQSNDKLNETFSAVMAQHFVNFLNDQGVKTGVDSQEIPPYEKVLKEYKVSYKDKRALLGQEALDYIKHNLALKDRYQEAYYDWLVVGRTFTYKDVYKNDLLHEIVPPLEMWHGPTKTGFVEDAAWAYRRSRFNLSEVIDRFHEVLEPDEIDELEQKYRNSDGLFTSSITTTINIDSQIDTNIATEQSLFNKVRGLIDVHHTVWKGFTKVGLLKYTDEMGNLQEMEVDDSYVLNEENGDVELEWVYMSEAYEVYRIGEDLYKYARPIQVQRQELSNTSRCKLPYNGRSGYSERNKITSIVKQVLPYQALINIYRYRVELIVAKNKEKMMLMPLGLMPDGDGWSQDKFLYYGETTGMLFFDETKPNAQMALNAIKAIDLSMGNYISQMRDLIMSTKEEMWDAIGMNRQRFGDVNSSDGKSTNEQAQIRSSVISREMNRRFERTIEVDLQGLVENSKAAWVDGKKASYINSEGKECFLEIDGHEWLDIDLGVFIVDSQDEQAKLNKVKEFAFGVAQKGGSPYSTVIDIIDSNNISKLKSIVNKAEEIEKEYQASVAQSQNEAAQALKQAELEKAQQEGNIKLQVEGIKSETAIKVALINNSGQEESTTPEQEYNNYDDYVNKTKENDLRKQKEGLGISSSTADKRLKEANLALAKEKIESAERIAKQNKNKYD